MNFTKKTVLVAAALAVFAGGGLYCFKLLSHGKAAPAAATVAYEPQAPATPAMLMMNESSGELSRVFNKDPKTGEIKTIDVGYMDGRKGQYIFQKGKLRFYKAFNQEAQLFYEAVYEPNGFISSYKYLRADGSVETSFQRQLDGTEELVFFNKEGYVISTTVTASDGGQARGLRPDPRKGAQVNNTKAEPNEQCFNAIKLPDGSDGWQLKVKLVGVRIKEWEYRDKNGMLRHQGKMRDDGNVEISVLRPDGKIGYKQTWTAVGEDWSRRIYRLESVEGFNESGETAAVIKFHPDGKTPREIANYNSYNGQMSSVDHVNQEGFVYKQEYFYGGTSNGGYELPPQYRRKVTLPPGIASEPLDSGSPVYRLKGMPYSTPAGDQNQTLSPLFVLPKN